MTEKHYKCKFCDKVYPESVYNIMLEHLITKHADEYIKLLMNGFQEITLEQTIRLLRGG